LTIELELDDGRRAIAQRVQLLQQAVGVAALAPAALHRIRSGAHAHVVFGVVEVAAIVLACIVSARDMRGGARAPRRFDPLSGLVGTVLLAEYGFRVAGGGKWFSATLVTALMYWALTIAGPWLEARGRRRRRMRIDGEGMRLGISAFRSFGVDWPAVARVEGAAGELRFLMKDRSARTLALGRWRNRDAIREAVARGAAAAAVPYEAR
jgi:hypothetical protein